MQCVFPSRSVFVIFHSVNPELIPRHSGPRTDTRLFSEQFHIWHVEESPWQTSGLSDYTNKIPDNLWQVKPQVFIQVKVSHLAPIYSEQLDWTQTGTKVSFSRKVCKEFIHLSFKFDSESNNVCYHKQAASIFTKSASDQRFVLWSKTKWLSH